MSSKFQLKNKSILLTSNERWGDVWFSKHNYANELSKENDVYFINPPRKWKPINLFSSQIKISKIKDRLHLVEYSNRIPRILKKVNNKLVSKSLYKKIVNNGATDIIFWSFDPIRLTNPCYFNPIISIFHSVDKYTFHRPSEREMCTKSDVIFTVSKEFILDLQPYGKPLLYVPHGIPSDDFMASETPQKIKNLLPKDYILYVGTVDLRLDYQLIDTLLCTFPEMKFVFVGPNQRPDDSIFRKIFETSIPSNLLILPPVHFKDLKYYISNSLACLAPMNPKAHGNNISHHKIFQYLAWGKPVFSCVFSEYLQFGELLYMDDNHQGIVDKLDLFLNVGEDKSLKEKRIEKASEMKFENHLKSIEQFLNDHPKLK